MPGSRRSSLPAALRAVLETAGELARHAPSARVVKARTAALFPQLEHTLPGPDRLPAKTIERVLADAWGQAPAKALDAWDDEPMAIRPGSQVHRGAVDGRPVAVKVLRPGLPAAVRADLVLLEPLGPPLGAAFPALDVAALLAEVREAALDELDLEHEGSTQRLIGRALRGVSGVTVPRVHGELTADTVLVTDLVDGAALDAGGRATDPGDAARALVRAHVEAVRRTGLVPSDPRPGHVIPTGDGVALLGVGVARPWAAERLDALLDGLAALRDPAGADGLAHALHDHLGVLPADAARAAHPLLREILGPLVSGSARLDVEALEQVARRALDRAADVAGLLACTSPDPTDVGAFRGAGQLVATLAALEATEDWVELVLSEASRGASSGAPGR